MDDLLKDYCDIAKKIGEEKGKAEGETTEKFATARRMLIKGKPTAEIVDLTELSLATVKKLQAEMLHTTV